MRFLPKSLAGQLIVFLLLGLFVTQLVSRSLSGKTHGSIHELSQEQLRERYATAYRVLSGCPVACDRAAMLAALSADDAQFFVSADADPPSPMSGDESRLADAFAVRLGAPLTGALEVHLKRSANADRAEHPLSVDVSTPLPGGGKLTGVMWPVVRDGWWHALGHGVLESGIAVFILVAIFVGRLRRPLRAITRAYDRLGRGETVAPLSQQGPRELHEVAVAFNLMQERLARFVGDRTRMVAAISHDFRTPITSLRLRVEMVDDRQLRSAMMRTLEEMRQMVEETLVFAREDSLNEASRTVDLAQLLAVLADEQSALGRDVRLHEAVALSYRCRPLALKRALNNLVDNAVRYGQRARLLLEPAPDSVRIIVEDDGPGIAEGCASELFKPFARAGRYRCGERERDGVGLGLAIARSCIQAHGGCIDLENRAQGGLRAIVQLPARTGYAEECGAA